MKAPRTVLKEAVIRYLGDVTLAEPPERIVRRVHKLDGWNDHEPSATARNIVLKLNGKVIAGYSAQYKAIEQTGLIGSHGHSPQALVARFRNVTVQYG